MADFYDVDIREILDGKRKSENMENEVKEVLTKVADYTDLEKERLLKSLFVNIAGILMIFLGMVIFNVFHLDESSELLHFWYLLMPPIGFMFTGWGLIRILQIRGNMNKYRMVKVKKVLLPVSCIFGLTVLIHCITLVSWFHSYNASDITEFDKNAVIDKFAGDLDSNLSIFPDEMVDDSKVYFFEADFKQDLFDTTGQIILACDYEDEQFEKEIERLSNLEIEITSLDGSETYLNKILYDTNSYERPAYIANAGFGNTYEYALINRESTEIVYLYLAYPNPDDFPHPEYLMLDSEAYNEENTFNAFSMYNHSFDGGKSFMEFDDK